jgi:hypothetical protein
VSSLPPDPGAGSHIGESTGHADRAVVIRGAAGGLLIAMSAALANVVLADQHPKPHAALNLTFLGLLLGFALSGFVAGYEATHDIARHGAFAALVAFIPVEVVGILGRLDRSERIAPLGIVIVAFVAAVAGMAGSSFGAAVRARRRERSEHGGSPP